MSFTTRLYDNIVTGDTQILLSQMEAMEAVEADRQREVLVARRYHEGKHGAKLTTRLLEFLARDLNIGGPEFRMNVCKNVVTALSERLIIEGFDSKDESFIEWAWNLWQALRLDSMQEEVHEAALRDGEYFIIVDWDEENERPCMTPHQRYTSIDVNGDGYGCKMFYEENDHNQKPLFGLKQWLEQSNSSIVERRTLYFPDRIERYIRDNRGEWTPFRGVLGDKPWPTPWVDNEDKPLGIALKHFKNKGLQCEAWDAIPMQNAINKSVIDLLSASDQTAFRVFVALGFIPTVDGKPPADDRSNWLEVEPGQIIGTTKPPGDASFNAIDPADLSTLMDLAHQLVLWAAMVTNTPVTRFISTKLIASDETLKEQEGPLLSRVRSRQTSFGNTWSECFELAAKLQNVMGEPVKYPEPFDLDPLWVDANARGQQERIDLLIKKQKLGIPRSQLWLEAGYNKKTIRRMEAEYQATQTTKSEQVQGQKENFENEKADEEQQEG
jgi:hypothetical protein